MIGFLCLIFYSTKIWNSFVESLVCIQGASAEPKDEYRVKLIVESAIGLLLEFDWY